MSILALIPARGGSKGIPGKNIKKLNGKPLIAWTIEVAKTISEIDRIVVSTDDNKIAKIAKQCGADVPFLRPFDLAQDNTPGIATVLHAIENIPEYYDEVLLLQPTSPLRISDDILGVINTARKNNAVSVVSISEVEKHPSWMFQMSDRSALVPLFEGSLELPRQQLAPYYSLNGAIFLANCRWLKVQKKFITSDTLGYVMPKERSVDLDTFFDWELAECLVKRRLK